MFLFANVQWHTFGSKFISLPNISWKLHGGKSSPLCASGSLKHIQGNKWWHVRCPYSKAKASFCALTGWWNFIKHRLYNTYNVIRKTCFSILFAQYKLKSFLSFPFHISLIIVLELNNKDLFSSYCSMSKSHDPANFSTSAKQHLHNSRGHTCIPTTRQYAKNYQTLEICSWTTRSGTNCVPPGRNYHQTSISPSVL
jgi:hypothetical protein